MPYIWLEPDEMKALRDVYDWRRRIGQPLDWDAFDRAMARLINGDGSQDVAGEQAAAGTANGSARKNDPS
jgi:hypothetical protein